MYNTYVDALPGPPPPRHFAVLVMLLLKSKPPALLWDRQASPVMTFLLVV